MDDGVVYQNPDKKSDGYTVVDGVSEKDLVIPYEDRKGQRKKNTTDLHHSTVTDVWCDAGFSIADLTFNFSITYRSPALTGNHFQSPACRQRLGDSLHTNQPSENHPTE